MAAIHAREGTPIEGDGLSRPAGATAPSRPLLQIEDLRTYFDTDRGIIKAVDGVSYEINPGEVLAVVGESGSGKSVTAMSIMGLVQSPPGRIASGAIRLAGEDLIGKSEREMLAIRGSRIAMIFQDPMTSLDPVFTIESQMAEAILQHRDVGGAEARDIAIEMLARVHIPDPARRLGAYPFELSGGLRQRVMIAMQLALRPSLLIADEPTTALDVTVQAQILSLLKEVQAEFNMAILLITHDFGVVQRIADRVAVMYAGRVMETASVRSIVETPRHPYTRALLSSRPRIGERGRLRAIPGTPPNLANPLPGCPFANRCAEVDDSCWIDVPRLRAVGPDRQVRCIREDSA
ncbi:ABC transporter ATP-binding protein [Rhodospirillaceae bacterium SYSU D60014]|uniref:ABC transporter ATP-binding protein n=1 Tax=Virgifigura deserti TaxID=2268457 RepID=UPI000E66FE52